MGNGCATSGCACAKHTSGSGAFGHFRSGPLPVGTTVSHVTDVTSGHVTSGSTAPSHHPLKCGLNRADILLLPNYNINKVDESKHFKLLPNYNINKVDESKHFKLLSNSMQPISAKLTTTYKQWQSTIPQILTTSHFKSFHTKRSHHILIDIQVLVLDMQKHVTRLNLVIFQNL